MSKNREALKSKGVPKKASRWVVGILITLLVISNGITLSLLFIGGEDLGDTVGELDGKPITSKELYTYMLKQSGDTLLQKYVEDKIITLDVERNSISVAQEDIDKEINALIAEYGSEEALESALKGYKQTRKDLESDIIKYLQKRELLLPRIDATEEKLKAYFEERKSNFEQKEQVRASHILVESEELANRLLNDIVGGADWKETALANSKDYYASTSDADGSDLGYFSRGGMIEEFEKVAFDMEVNDRPRITQTQYGFHIIKVTDKVAFKEAIFEDVREQVELAYLEENSDSAYASWLEERKQEFNFKSKLK